jgi:glycosyltransferase involved in cell wall biosynthesis
VAELSERHPGIAAKPVRFPRRLAIVPAFNEEDSVGAVIDEIRVARRDFDVVVIDDGSDDRTAAVAGQHGAAVVRLPFNLGIGGAMQTGFQFARDRGYDIAVQVDADGQHDARAIETLLAPLVAGEADMVVGSRFVGERPYRIPFARRMGIAMFAAIVSLIVRQRVTDTTSGFRAANRRCILLFAADYPHDYPEVEAMVLVTRQRLRLLEVPVAMRERQTGSSSITALRSLYYMLKVTLALFVGLFRRSTVRIEEGVR